MIEMLTTSNPHGQTKLKQGSLYFLPRVKRSYFVYHHFFADVDSDILKEYKDIAEMTENSFIGFYSNLLTNRKADTVSCGETNVLMFLGVKIYIDNPILRLNIFLDGDSGKILSNYREHCDIEETAYKEIAL